MDPYKQFKIYYQEAEKVYEKEPLNSMCLSTVDTSGHPHSRMVLFKGIVEDQFSFFTNYNSNKAKDIEQNPNISLLFYWEKTGKQVRVEGIASKAPRDFVVNYWNSRPFESQVSGAVSDQSQPISHYQSLVKKYEQMRASLTKVLCPEHWGGYFITPNYFEFWEANPFRLHKRLVFTKMPKGWETSQLSP